MDSPLDKIAVLEAVVCSRPVKNRIGAAMAPDAVIGKIYSQSFFLIFKLFVLYARGTETDEARRYTIDAKRKGLTFSSTGFEAVEIEPTKIADSMADA